MTARSTGKVSSLTYQNLHKAANGFVRYLQFDLKRAFTYLEEFEVKVDETEVLEQITKYKDHVLISFCTEKLPKIFKIVLNIFMF